MTQSATGSHPLTRYAGPDPTVATGWRLERLTAPSRLSGANGLRAGPGPGAPLVAESGAGRVVAPAGGPETVVNELPRPQGIAVDLNTGTRETIASGLPVGPPTGVEPKPLKGMPPFSGPQGPFAGITVGGDGTLYVSADGEVSVLALRRP